MITKLGPGWLCQPKLPPGAILLDRTWMSVAPVVFISAVHAPILPFVSMEPNFPIPKIVGWTPKGGVANTVPAYTAAPRAAASEAHANFDLISPPFRLCGLDQANGRQARGRSPASAPARRIGREDDGAELVIGHLGEVAWQCSPTLRGRPQFGNVKISELCRAASVLTPSGGRAPFASAHRAWRRHGIDDWRPSAP